MSNTVGKIVPFNEVEGIASTNVPAYSSKYTSTSRGGPNFVNGVFTGYKWQCVEFARRWLLLRKTCTFMDVPCAYNIWTDVPYIEQVTDGRKFRLHPCPNGSMKPPTKDTLLIYSRNRKMPYGHVAIITKVTDTHVYIAEQNNLFHYWPGDYARRERILCEDGRYYIDDEDPILGWMEIEGIEQLEPLNESKLSQILSEYRDSAI